MGRTAALVAWAVVPVALVVVPRALLPGSQVTIGEPWFTALRLVPYLGAAWVIATVVAGGAWWWRARVRASGA